MSTESTIWRQLVTIQHRAADLPRPPRRLLQGTSILLFGLLWWFVVEAGVLRFDLIPGPLETMDSLLTYLGGEPLTQGGSSLYEHSYHTFYRVGLGVGLAVATAIPLGLLCGWSRLWRDYVYPSLEVLRPIPPVAWVPIALLAFESGLRSIVWVVYVGAFFPIFVNTMEGVGRIEEEYVMAVRSLGGNRRSLFRHVVVPHTLPAMVTGTMIGVGIGWIAVVAAEMLSGENGVGYVTWQAYRLMNTETVVVGIVVLGAYGALSSAAVAVLGERLTPWADDLEAR